jgi:propionyl-CoA synthetase
LSSLPLVSKLEIPTKPPRYSSLSQRKPNKQIGVPTGKVLPSMPDNTEDYHIQDEVLRHSLQDPEEFWRHQAEHLHWHKPFSSTIQLTQKTLKNGVTHDSWEWFPDGEISTCYNCVDRHVLDGHGDSVAIYFDSPVTNTKEKYTYSQLLHEVETLAGALREQGINKGDVVMLYSK